MAGRAGQGGDMTISLEGKTAIVTFGGQDIGRSVAARFLEAGARVMLAGTDERALAEIEDLIAQGEGACQRFSYVAQDKLSISPARLTSTLSIFAISHRDGSFQDHFQDSAGSTK